MKACFFIGHRDTPTAVEHVLRKQIEYLVEECGVNEFIIGRYGNFDRMAAHAVRILKGKYPHIKLTVLLSYYPPKDKEILQSFDSVLYPERMENVPKKAAIVRANQYAAEVCDFLICYVKHSGSNARNIMEYALSKGKNVINIAD